MRVSYQHANPHNCRESTLVRFYDEIRDEMTCILVDIGDGVDVDALPGEDEYLSAICLTHAHRIARSERPAGKDGGMSTHRSATPRAYPLAANRTPSNPPATAGKQPGTVGAERREGWQRRAWWAIEKHCSNYFLLSPMGHPPATAFFRMNATIWVPSGATMTPQSRL